jgi:hypothetical protein
VLFNAGYALWYTICVPWFDTATNTKTVVTVSIEGTASLFLDDFMRDGGSDLIPRRDILIPRFVFRGPKS